MIIALPFEVPEIDVDSDREALIRWIESSQTAQAIVMGAIRFIQGTQSTVSIGPAMLILNKEYSATLIINTNDAVDVEYRIAEINFPYLILL